MHIPGNTPRGMSVGSMSLRVGILREPHFASQAPIEGPRVRVTRHGKYNFTKIRSHSVPLRACGDSSMGGMTEQLNRMESEAGHLEIWSAAAHNGGGIN